MSGDMVTELQKLRVPAGVATARTLSELEESLPSGKVLGDVFKGDLLLEDGGVLVPSGQTRGDSMQVEALVNHSALEAVSVFRKFLEQSFVDLGRSDGFGRLSGLSEPLVKFPPNPDFLTSITLWEKGPVGDSSFAFAYDWCRERLRRQGLDLVLALTEVGDGTLRITVPGMNKGAGLEQLVRRRRLDLARTAYFGDGANDVPAATVVKDHGGIVVSVGSSTPALMALADHVTRGEGPDVVAKILRRLNRSTL